jgi:hypothetical protein
MNDFYQYTEKDIFSGCNPDNTPIPGMSNGEWGWIIMSWGGVWMGTPKWGGADMKDGFYYITSCTCLIISGVFICLFKLESSFSR